MIYVIYNKVMPFLSKNLPKTKMLHLVKHPKNKYVVSIVKLQIYLLRSLIVFKKQTKRRIS